MRLLVSVRCRAEVPAALSGGADIIDAKEPGRGSLGPVDAAVLAEISASVPDAVPLSVALGDYGDEQVAGSPLLGGRARYLKIGFAGVSDETAVRRVIGAAVAAAETRVEAGGIVAVAYADAPRAGALDPRTVARIAIGAHAGGVLLDTCVKDGRDLLSWMEPAALREWVGMVREAGLLAAVAGSLCADRIPEVAAAGPDVIGIRGAACEGGRSGPVSAERVRAVRSALPPD